jgi:hypothetical protein
MAVLTILMTGAARQAADRVPPAALPNRPCLPAEPVFGREGVGFIQITPSDLGRVAVLRSRQCEVRSRRQMPLAVCLLLAARLLTCHRDGFLVGIGQSREQLLGYVPDRVPLAYLRFGGGFDRGDGVRGATVEHAAPELKVGRSVIAVDATGLSVAVSRSVQNGIMSGSCRCWWRPPDD